MHGATNCSENMPSAAARRLYEDQIPTFMSVFDLDAVTLADCDMVTIIEPKLVGMDSKTVLPTPAQTHALHHSVNHKHRDSNSTQMSESTDSSPTTTLSTTDSSPLTDRSPSSSPDSPVIANLVSLNNYPSTTFGALPVTNSTGMLPIPEPAGHLNRPMTSPMPRRPRNMKGLSISPPLALTTSAIASPLEPSSPSFIKPQIPAMKRKPSQLSLRTNAQDLMPSTLQVPSSPAMPPILQRRALKHSTSTPHILSRITTQNPASSLPTSNMLERNESGLSEVLRPTKTSVRTSSDSPLSHEGSPIKTQMANRQEFEPHHESLNNEDQKSPTYPNGPIAIYGNEVYLYLEPTIQEASKFDVVFNVAHEVENPFEMQARQQSEKSSKQAPNWSPVPDTAATFATAYETQPDDSEETPTTPKAGNSLKTPEYIHIPWDHNTDITPDLMNLCQTIHARTKQGKKILIHCQQGASRSASLIIAYGLYLNPHLSVNDAYYAAQAKSRWISPNMKLMYCLQDFQKEVSQKKPTSNICTFRPRPGRSPTKHRLTISADAIDVSVDEPLSAPLPAAINDKDRERQEKLKDGSKRARGNSSPGLQSISPGPASAPLHFSWRNVESPSTKNDKTEPAAPPMPTMAPPPIPMQKSQTGPLETSNQDQVSRQSKSILSRSAPGSKGYAESWLRNLRPTVGQPRAEVGMGAFPLRSFQDEVPPGFASHAISVPGVSTPTTPYDKVSQPSPRAEVMSNPTRDFAVFSGFSGMQFANRTTTTAYDEGVFSPRGTSFPPEATFFFGQPSPIADPRSPPARGEAPITRSIDDMI